MLQSTPLLMPRSPQRRLEASQVDLLAGKRLQGAATAHLATVGLLPPAAGVPGLLRALALGPMAHGPAGGERLAVLHPPGQAGPAVLGEPMRHGPHGLDAQPARLQHPLSLLRWPLQALAAL